MQVRGQRPRKYNWRVGTIAQDATEFVDEITRVFRGEQQAYLAAVQTLLRLDPVCDPR